MSTKITYAPTWEETARILTVLITDGDVEGKNYALKEVIRMGEIIDELTK